MMLFLSYVIVPTPLLSPPQFLRKSEYRPSFARTLRFSPLSDLANDLRRKEKATGGVYSAGFTLSAALDIAADVYHGVRIKPGRVLPEHITDPLC